MEGKQIHPVPLHVVGVAEESLFWKDIKRVPFSRAELLVMCRMSKPGRREKDSWSSMKLGQVIGSVAPDIERKIKDLSLERIFNASESENGKKHDDLTARRALLEYAMSLLEDNGCSLGAAELGELDAIIFERSSDFRSVEQKFFGFKAIEEYLAGRFSEIEIGGDEEHGRQEMVLASAGVSYLNDGLPSEVEENGEGNSEQHPLILDTEFIVIYW